MNIIDFAKQHGARPATERGDSGGLPIGQFHLFLGLWAGQCFPVTPGIPSLEQQ